MLIVTFLIIIVLEIIRFLVLRFKNNSYFLSIRITKRAFLFYHFMLLLCILARKSYCGLLSLVFTSNFIYRMTFIVLSMIILTQKHINLKILKILKEKKIIKKQNDSLLVRSLVPYRTILLFPIRYLNNLIAKHNNKIFNTWEYDFLLHNDMTILFLQYVFFIYNPNLFCYLQILEKKSLKTHLFLFLYKESRFNKDFCCFKYLLQSIKNLQFKNFFSLSKTILLGIDIHNNVIAKRCYNGFNLVIYDKWKRLNIENFVNNLFFLIPPHDILIVIDDNLIENVKKNDSKILFKTWSSFLKNEKYIQEKVILFFNCSEISINNLKKQNTYVILSHDFQPISNLLIDEHNLYYEKYVKNTKLLLSNVLYNRLSNKNITFCCNGLDNMNNSYFYGDHFGWEKNSHDNLWLLKEPNKSKNLYFCSANLNSSTKFY